MKKIILTLILILSVNAVFAQYAYQSVLDSIEVNSTVLAAHYKHNLADRAENDAYSLFENPEIEAGYKFGAKSTAASVCPARCSTPRSCA